MAITAQDFVDALNIHGIDTPAKCNDFVAIASLQVSRVGKQIALAALDAEQNQAVQAIEQKRQVLSAAIQADTSAIIAALPLP